MLGSGLGYLVNYLIFYHYPLPLNFHLFGMFYFRFYYFDGL